MDPIPSFSVDHTKIVPGIFESRVDTIGTEKVTTFDIRLKRPNVEPAIDPAAMHTIEHIIATYLRNDPNWKDQLIYWGPMGCQTGFYMIVKGRPTPKEIYPIIKEAFKYLSNYEGPVPGATPKNCGKYLMHNLPMARLEAQIYIDYLIFYEVYVEEQDKIFEYPKAERLQLENNQEFFDS